jgi:hypothetical protein
VFPVDYWEAEQDEVEGSGNNWEVVGHKVGSTVEEGIVVGNPADVEGSFVGGCCSVEGSFEGSFSRKVLLMA